GEGGARLPLLSALRQDLSLAYPDVELEITAEDRHVDPVEDGYDLVIRINPSPDDRLVGRRFLNDERLVVAPPDLARPAILADGAAVKAVLLSATAPDVTWRIRTAEGGEAVLRPEPVLRLSSL